MTTERVFDYACIATDPGHPRSGGEPERQPLCRGRHPSTERVHQLPYCALTEAFRSHLAMVRARGHGPVPGALRCRARPLTPSTGPAGHGENRKTALPHLVAVRHLDQRVRDHIIWEVMDWPVLRGWLPDAEDPDRWVARIPRLCVLREWLRHHPESRGDTDDPVTAPLEQLRRLLGEHYLSIKFVLLNPGAVDDALAALADVAPFDAVPADARRLARP